MVSDFIHASLHQFEYNVLFLHTKAKSEIVTSSREFEVSLEDIIDLYEAIYAGCNSQRQNLSIIYVHVILAYLLRRDSKFAANHSPVLI